MEQDQSSTQEQEPPKHTLRDRLSVFIPRKGYFFTPILIDINIAVFLLMVISGVSFTLPDAESLLKWGANYRQLTLGGQPWRLFTSMFLHFGIIHLAVNMYSLYSLGQMLERFIGKWRFIALYLFTGLCGSALSLWWHDYSVVSAGASGAIFGLFGVFAAIVTTQLIRPEIRKELLIGIGKTILLNAAIGLWSGIDNSAHIGGFLSGILGGYLIYPDLKAFYQERIKKYTGLFIALFVLAGIIVGLWIATPPKAGLDLYTNRYDAEMDAARKFLLKTDSSTTLEAFNTNVTERYEHALSLLDTIESYRLPEEAVIYFGKIHEATSWGMQGCVYFQRSLKEHRPDFHDSAEVMFKKQENILEALNAEMQDSTKGK